MCKMKEFNNTLNSSLNYQNELKIKYKHQVNSIINKTIQAISKTSKCCVIGTGKMEDFSLSFFTENFEQTTLTDIDIKTVKNNINNESSKVRFHEVEYTGFQDFKFFEDFSTIKNKDSFDEIDLFLSSKITKIKEYSFMGDYNEMFDLVYVSPIYTQLVYNQLLYECSSLRSKGHPEHLLKYIENMMLDEMVGVISRFNSNIAQLLKTDGFLIVLSDIFQMDVGSSFDQQVHKAIGDFNLVEKIHSDYVSKYGMGLGDFGLYDMDSKMQLQSSEWIIWPFTEKINFAVKCNVYKKN